MITKKTAPRRGLILCGIFFISTLIVTGCTKTATDSGEEKRERFTGAGAWSVNGIKVWQTLSSVKEARGKPNQSVVTMAAPIYTWPDGVVVEAHEKLQVKTVYGTVLNIGATVVISDGLSTAQTQQILGDGIKKVFRAPRGSGVISTGYVLTGMSLTYERDGIFFVLGYNKNDQFTGVNASVYNPYKKR